VTGLTPIQLPTEADDLNLKDELVLLNVNLKKLGYDFTDNLRDTQMDVEDSDARQCVLGPNLIICDMGECEAIHSKLVNQTAAYFRNRIDWRGRKSADSSMPWA
jgi:hypothetical protein